MSGNISIPTLVVPAFMQLLANAENTFTLTADADFDSLQCLNPKILIVATSTYINMLADPLMSNLFVPAIPYPGQEPDVGFCGTVSGYQLYVTNAFPHGVEITDVIPGQEEPGACSNAAYS